MKTARKEIEKGLDNIIKTTNKVSKNLLDIDPENYLKKKKIKK